ncbi:M12 family metallo-peptidase [Ferruginibacter lapsinanis]|uniref:reprolysin-like metallopeptidase n=1 Tax=Ferruginibacter lapsinanis TaxID=563172 RepID=UPI001E2EA605|nr:zinc-dependent metalloprotease family protein [Ferruginibacter lapsinanis]UEG49276.1 M12 family metallo-peptidase [Ferruginibacter lapsinanis]
MKKIFTKALFILLLAVISVKANAQNNFFADKPEKAFRQTELKPIVKPSKYRTVSLDTTAFKKFLQSLPALSISADRNNTPVLELPMPNGTTAKFHVWETEIMAPELAAKFPDIKTYTGQGVDDKTATIKIDWTPLGFHAMILSALSGTILIDPYSNGNKVNYISYFKSDFKKKGAFKELAPKKLTENLHRPIQGNNILAGVGTQLRTYRLAIACTHQYAAAVCSPSAPTVALTLSAIVTAVNRINQVYEKELSIHFTLIANENSIIFPTAGVDPFTGNDDAQILVDESQSVIGTTIGSANYDIGHTFSTGAGGAASVGVVCSTNHKAEGVTGTSNPVGDPFVIDYVCHEMGHQFNADHSFNSELDFCGSPLQWNATTNAEPGSGSTIMGYSANPAICGTDNLQNNSDAVFHTVSFIEISTFSVNGGGNSCAVKTATGNTIPVVNAGADYIIPKSTPFRLSGSATDANGDALSYSWEQIDVGAPASKWNEPSGTSAPLFRSFLPVDSGVRYFPKISDVVNNTTTIGELLPAIARPMNFRLTARDNRAGGGGVNYDDILVTVNSDGPFKVTYPTAAGITWTGNTTQTVTWDVANTNISPVSTANVSIELSTDGGYTYPITLIASTPNDGSQTITVPNVATTTTARIRVKAVGNIFYNISSNNFNILFVTPVTWVEFSAQKNFLSTNLKWIVNEQNASFYEIERSSDGINFSSIGKVSAQNYASTSQQYSFADTTPLSGINYYRIKQVDKSGQVVISQIVSVLFNTEKITCLIFPNPTKGILSVMSNVDAGKTQYQVFDAAGKLVINKELSKISRGQLTTLYLGNYSKGIYTLKVNSTTFIKIEKILLQ